MPSARPPPIISTAVKILRPPPGGRPGLLGSFIAATLTQVRRTARGLSLAGAALLLEPSLAARLGRLGGPPRARHVQRVRDPLLQALERQLAVPRLAPRVL